MRCFGERVALDERDIETRLAVLERGVLADEGAVALATSRGRWEHFSTILRTEIGSYRYVKQIHHTLFGEVSELEDRLDIMHRRWVTKQAPIVR